MTGEHWIVNNPGQLDERLGYFRDHIIKQNIWPICWQAKRYTSPRSMDQNALFWVWAGEFARFLLDKQKITVAEKEDMAYTLQRRCYADTGWDWLITQRTDLMGGGSRTDRRSTTKFAKGEMMVFLDWVQMQAADRGLILEARGEYQELKDAQAA